MTSITSPVPGNLLSDIILWVRRIIKSASNQTISDATIADYINRFYTYDVPERVQLFELKRQYTFETTPNVFIYQFPYLQYQYIESPAYCDGYQLGFYTSNDQFYRIFPEFVNNETPIQGDGTVGEYQVTFGRQPILPGFTDALGNILPYVYITATDVNNIRHFIVDDGTGNLLEVTNTWFGNQIEDNVINESCGSVNYITGNASFTFSADIPASNSIETQTSPYSAGAPRILLFFNNTIKLYPVPDRSYKIQADAFITPAQFLDTNSPFQFSYMAEYLARGAARKILQDNADYDQMQFYEPWFREQENLVLRRTSRIRNINRTPTIFSTQTNQNDYRFTQY